MSGRAHAEAPSRASAPHPSTCAAIALALLFVGIASPALPVLPQDFDEGWFMLDARSIAAGARPFVDFPHHEMPLHLYLLAASGRLVGETILGWRVLSLLSLASSGVVLFALARPIVGPLPALVAEVVFLFSPVHGRSLTAVPETPALLFLLLGAFFLFARDGRWSASASGIAFAIAVLLKPQYLLVAGGAVGALAVARAWRRLADFAAAGILAGLAAAVWVLVLSDGIVADVVRFQLAKIGTGTGGMWSIASGFDDMRKILGVATPRQWAWLNFRTFIQTRTTVMPIALFVLALAALPIWVFGCARRHAALRAFVVLWPASLLILNFAVLEFVSPRYFIPYVGFAAFLVAGWVWLAERRLPTWAVGAMAAVACALLVGRFATTLGADSDPWFWDRVRAIAAEHRSVVSFDPIAFAATATEPACRLANPALAYGSFGDHILAAERLRRFQVHDEDLIACLRNDPGTVVVVDWAFYFFTRPGSALRAYLAGEGSAQRVFFSPEAVQQWNRPLLQMNPLR